MPKAKKILLICSGLETPGGIERATINLSNLLSSSNDVTLLILDKTPISFYEIDPKVTIEHRYLHFGIIQKGNPIIRKLQFLQHIFQLKGILKKINPDIIISTEYSFAIASYFAKQSHMILYSWEHHHFYWLKKNKFWRILQKWIYPRVNSIICLNNTEASLYQAAGCSTFIIPNFCEKQDRRTGFENKTLLTIGWLIKRKGVDLIPEIAQKLFTLNPDWKWNIIGKGPLEKDLQLEIRKKKLENFVSVYTPTSPDLSDVYTYASIYVMTSRFECFPMVLLEAKSFGLPAVAFNCPTGPADIITSGDDGILIDPGNTDAFVEALNTLIKNKTQLQQMGLKAYNNSKKFESQNILALWQMLFDNNKKS